MVRVGGVNIPDHKHIEVSLTYIKGIGRSRAKEIVKRAKVDGAKKVKDLADAQLEAVRNATKNYEDSIEGNLLRNVRQDIERLKHIGCYRGIRHRMGQLVRGQKNRNKTGTKRRRG